MLNRLVLRDFKRHEDLDVEFTDGLNVLFGANYKGKTSVLHAFLYALGGPGLVPGGSAWVDRRDTAGGKHKAEVKAWFTVSGTRFLVERTGTKCNLFELLEDAAGGNGEQVNNRNLRANSASAVAAELAEILGFPVRRLSQLKYAEQGDMKALLTLGVGELNKIVEEVAEVELVNTGLKGCSKIVSDCNSKLDVLGPQTVDMAALLEEATQIGEGTRAEDANLQQHRGRLSVARDELSQAEGALTTARQLADQAAEHNRQAVEHNRELALLEQGLGHKAQHVETLEAELQPLTDKAEELGSAADVVEALDAAEQEASELQRLTTDHAKSQQELRSARLAAERALSSEGVAVTALKGANQKACSDLGVEPDGEMTEQMLAKELIEELQNQLRGVDAQGWADEVADARSTVSQLEKALSGAACPSCTRPFEDHDPEKLERELRTAKEDLAAKQKKLTEARTTLENHTALRSGLERYLSQAEAAEKEARHCQDLLNAVPCVSATHIAQATEDLAQANHKVADIRVKLNEIRSLQSRITQLTANLADKREALQSAKAKLATCKLMELQEVPSLAAYMQSRDTASEAVNQLVQEVHTSELLLSNLSSRRETVNAKIKAAEEHEKRLASITSRKASTTGLREYLTDNRDRFMSKVWDGIMAQVTAFTSACTGGDIQSVSRQEDAFYYDCGLAEAMPVAGTASGAQKTFMGVGMQLSLATMMNTGFNTLLLDEPSADLNEESSLAFLAALKASGQQIIIISHSREDAALADNTIEIL